MESRLPYPGNMDFKKDEEENLNSFYGLPLNCIINIFYFLEDLDRRNLGLTCKKMDYVLQGYVGFTHFVTSNARYDKATDGDIDGCFLQEFVCKDNFFQIRLVITIIFKILFLIFLIKACSKLCWT